MICVDNSQQNLAGADSAFYSEGGVRLIARHAWILL